MARQQERSYFDVVWRQLRLNGPAFWSLCLLFPTAAVPILAPVLASNQPFVFRDGDDLLFPWFRHLFATDEPVNFLFNMTLLALVPWLIASFALGYFWKRRGVPRPKRAIRSAWLLVLFSMALTAVFGPRSMRPSQAYASRSFGEEELGASDRRGFYPPIPFGPTEQDLDATFAPPMFHKPNAAWTKTTDASPHLLGTDNTGRDVLAQMIYGSRISMTVGFIAVGLYLSIGTLVGALAGYFGGKTDLLISRIIEVVLLFPAFFLTLTLVAVVGPSIYIIVFVIGITGWPTIARLIRAEVLKQRALDYVTAARACGATHRRIILRHVLPNSLGPALVAAPFGVATAIMTEAGLSLLGFGVQPPTPSWGTLLRVGSANYNHWWLVVVPSLAILFVVTLFNLVGSGLRDAMDPKLRAAGE